MRFIRLSLALALTLASVARAQVATSVFTTPNVVATTTGPWIPIPAGFEADLEFSAVTATNPTAPTAALVATSSGNCTAGTHVFAVTYVTAAGETAVSSASGSVLCDGTHKQVTVTIPVSTTNGVTGRNIYASATGTTTPLLLVATGPVVANNTATTYTLNIADGSFTATTAPSSNTTGTSAATQKVFVTNDSTIAGTAGIEVTATPNSAITNPSTATHQGFIVRSYKFFCVGVTSYTSGTLATTYQVVPK